MPMGCVGDNGTVCHVCVSVHERGERECVCKVSLHLTGSAQEHLLDGV